MTSTSGEHSMKRKRVKEPEPDASLPTHVRGKPYFDDGNIILSVKNTHFRVYRGILATLSPVLSDMFALPQPLKYEVLDGCPVIVLDDSVEDWHTILSTIFSSFEYSEKLSLPMHVVETCLRLGTKYHMEEFRTQAIKRLSYEFPATLEEFDAMHIYARIDKCASYADEIFTVVNLARSYDHPRFLPCAFVDACELLSFEDIFRQTRPSLSREDQQICVVGWRKLLYKRSATMFGWLTPGNDPCSVQSCRFARYTLLVKELFPSEDPSGEMMPTNSECMASALASWQKKWEENLCGKCVTAARAEHQHGRQKMWDALPSIFGLPDWADMIKP